jgi:hypothetical protein
MPIDKDLMSEDLSGNGGKTKGSRTHGYVEFLLCFLS